MSTEPKLKKAIFSHIKITMPCSLCYCEKNKEKISFYVFFLYALTWHDTVQSSQFTCCSRIIAPWCIACIYMSVLSHLLAGLWHAVIGDSNRNHSDIGDRWFFDKVCDISEPLTSLARLRWQAKTYRLAFVEQLTQQLKKVGREKDNKYTDRHGTVMQSFQSSLLLKNYNLEDSYNTVLYYTHYNNTDLGANTTK